MKHERKECNGLLVLRYTELELRPAAGRQLVRSGMNLTMSLFPRLSLLTIRWL